MSNRFPLLAKAKRYIQSAHLLMNDNDLDSAASRLYYAMFYVAETLLDAKGLSFSSHRGVISAFGQHFAKTGELDPRFHRILITAFAKRQLGDYAATSGISCQEVGEMLTEAQDFLAEAHHWLARQETDEQGE